jgi:hypothetical protein
VCRDAVQEEDEVTILTDHKLSEIENRLNRVFVPPEAVLLEGKRAVPRNRKAIKAELAHRILAEDAMKLLEEIRRFKEVAGQVHGEMATLARAELPLPAGREVVRRWASQLEEIV